MSLTNVQPTVLKALVRVLSTSCLCVKSRVISLAPGTHPSFQTTFIDPTGCADAAQGSWVLLKTPPFTSDQKFDIELQLARLLATP